MRRRRHVKQLTVDALALAADKVAVKTENVRQLRKRLLVASRAHSPSAARRTHVAVTSVPGTADAVTFLPHLLTRSDAANDADKLFAGRARVGDTGSHLFASDDVAAGE